uniref:Uncharacterized protein n=1 Tax=Panagrolaimus sp. JU765 TaxID=591449 RepID=A0AC34QHS8_9BILA
MTKYILGNPYKCVVGGSDFTDIELKGFGGGFTETGAAGLGMTGAAIFLASLGFFGTTPFANNPAIPGEGVGAELDEAEVVVDPELALVVLLVVFPTKGPDLSFVTAFFSFVPRWISVNNCARSPAAF